LLFEFSGISTYRVRMKKKKNVKVERNEETQGVSSRKHRDVITAAVGFWIGFSRNRHRGIVTGKRRSYGYDSERRFSRPNAGKRCEVAVHKTNRKNDVAHGGVWNNRGLGSILIVFFFFSAGVDSAENYLFLFCYFFSALFIVLWSLSLLLRGPRRE